MALTNSASAALFERARSLFPGGVNSPVRAFKAVGGTPPFIRSARGCRITDEDGNEYLDFLSSWGPLILGHAHPEVVQRIREALDRGFSYGAPHEAEMTLASLVQYFFPSMEMMRFVSSGTEAAMSAVRLARGFTGKRKIIKFEGCYHGHADCLLAKAGSGAATFDLPDSMGVPPSMTEHTVTVPYNDIEALRRAVHLWEGELAAVIAEPVAGNMGVVPPAENFLQQLRDLTSRTGSLLVFDEVITGFRVAPGGAQQRYGVTPDLTVLGKILGGGMPIGAYGGGRKIMECIAPCGGVYQAGTLSGNPAAVASGIAMLEIIRREEHMYDSLEKMTLTIENALKDILNRKGIAHSINRVASMFTLFFNDGKVSDFRTAKASDTGLYGRFHQKALEHGLYMPPSQFEASFVSCAFKDSDIERAAESLSHVLSEL